MPTLTAELISQLKQTIRRGGLIAYPTEGVYGLGCDPFNEKAVKRIASLKQRTLDKGFILIAADWSQIHELIAPITPQALQRIKASWPGPTTWLFPCTDKVPTWISANRSTVALRLTAHPIAKAICQAVDQAVVSTSANLTGNPPLTTADEVKNEWCSQIDLIIDAAVGGLQQATPIRDAISGDYLRQ